ncbi:mechanosensitive ion channel family protein [Baekduia soli]|uniref:Mechanosensitive ion channel family protein n=2 Tax=Baekduia soli TaxID=496014 RepID=A0A5B8U7I5_9ACTN|nr:mechanosensitive ion channel family protein [Baekduia soli]
MPGLLATACHPGLVTPAPAGRRVPTWAPWTRARAVGSSHVSPTRWWAPRSATSARARSTRSPTCSMTCCSSSCGEGLSPPRGAPGMCAQRHTDVQDRWHGGRANRSRPRPDPEPMKKLLHTRSHSWREAGLARQLSARAVKRARIQSLVLLPMIAGVLVLYSYRRGIFGVDEPVRIGTVLALVALGWQFARDLGRAAGPTLFRRLDPGTAGTVGFIVRFFTVVASVVVALRVAGLDPRTLAVGGAFTAVILGLAAQQTFGNLFAGLVLLSARPFRVGDRVRLQGGGLAGNIEGVVSSLGLLYTIFSNGEDQIMVPNNVVLNVAVIPLNEPSGVDLRARLRPGVTPVDIQALLEETVETPMRDRPRVALEEIDGDETVVRIGVSPENPTAGARLSSEVLRALASETRRAEAA